MVQIARASVNSTVSLATDSAIALPSAVANAAALPATPVNGMLRSISSQVYEFVTGSTLPTSADVLGGTGGQWIARSGTFNTNLANSTDGGGCDRPLDLIAPTALRAPVYGVNGANGTSRTFWIVNDEAAPIPQGTRIGLSVLLNGNPVTDNFAAALQVRFLGYANLTTGDRRTIESDGDVMPWVDVDRTLEPGKFDLRLSDPLQPGEAFAFAVYPRFTPAMLNGRVPSGVLSIAPFLYSEAGTFTPMGLALGDWLYPVGDRALVTPKTGLTVSVGSRSGIVASRSFVDVPASDVSGLLPNTAAQQIVINGNGAAYVRSGAPGGSAAIVSGEGLRASVSTVSGTGIACALSAAVTIAASRALQVTIALPSNGSIATIRSGYPDLLLAGKSAKLNAQSIAIYVQSGSIIRRFIVPFVDGANQIVTLSDWNAGTTIASIPTPTDASFSLFTPQSAIATATATGNFPAGSIQVAAAFVYDGNAVTSIAHSGIATPTQTLAQIEQSTQVWGLPVDESAIVNIPQVNVVSWQTRRTTTGRSIHYDPNSTATHNGTSVWRPVWRSASDPGRWIGGAQADSVTLKPLAAAPTTNAEQVAIFADATDGNRIKSRAPGNGAIEILGRTVPQTGSGPPSPVGGAAIAPRFLGDLYLDTTEGAMWYAIALSAAASSWRKLAYFSN